MKLSPNEAVWCLIQVGFTKEQAIRGCAIGLAESDLDTEALGHRSTSDPLYGNYDHGWMQGSNKWHGAKLLQYPDWRDPLENAKLARAIFLEKERIQQSKGEPVNGWLAWKAFDNSDRFMPAATIAAQAPFPPPRTSRSLLARLRRTP